MLGIGILTALGASGCPPVDNSGGFAPEGESLNFVTVAEVGVVCASLEDTARFLEDLPAVDDAMASCADGAETVASATADLDDALAAQYDGERELLVVASTGGCITMNTLYDVRLDTPDEGAPVLRPWILRADESFEADASCDAAAGQTVQLVRIASTDAEVDPATATSVDLAIGVYNPTLPGAPPL